MTGKFHFTRWGIIALAVVVALATIGVTYAGMSGKPLKNDVVVWTGTFDHPLTWVVSNDNGAEESGGVYNLIDPGDNGLDPSQPQTRGVELPAEGRYDKDVALTTVSLVDQYNITVVLDNAYPSYYPTIFYGIKNTGNIPGEIVSIIIDEDYTDEDDDVADDIAALTVTAGGIQEGQGIDPGEEVIGDLAIHVEQAAEQNAGVAGSEIPSYTIRVAITIAAAGVGGAPGFWQNWGAHYPEEQVAGWMASVDTASQWLVPADIAEPSGTIDTDDLDAVLKAGIGKGATEETRFLRHYLATRLNVEADRLFPNSIHDVTDYDPDNYLGLDAPAEAKLSEIFDAIESKYGTSPTDEEYNLMKRICEALNKVKI